MNTYHFGTGATTTNKDYNATGIAPQLRYCIWFRHTVYMNRAYSCGRGGNEGQATTGVAAVPIPGTVNIFLPSSPHLIRLAGNTIS